MNEVTGKVNKEKPILFNGDMVRAILDGRKTQTRRPVNIDMANAFDPPRGKDDVADGYPWFEDGEGSFHKAVDCCPFGQVGDRLWVKETFRLFDSSTECACYDDCCCSKYHGKPVYRADCDNGERGWRPSIHMPRWACRIVLEITNIRVERVQDIEEDDCEGEGIKQRWTCINPGVGSYARDNDVHDDFHKLWDSIYSARGLGWDVNPWVWVIEFKMVEG